MGSRVLVIGGSVEGVRAALALAESGINVTLVEESCSITGSDPDSLTGILPDMPVYLKAAAHPNISVLTGASLVEVKKEDKLSVTLNRLPRFVRSEACTSCGRCERECPVKIVPPGDGQAHRAIHRPAQGMRSVPSAYLIDKKGIPPCRAACPAGVNNHGYVTLISKRKFAEALDLITESVPFPRVLGRVCSHPCEARCTRAKIDKAVSICALKRYVADHNSTETSLKRTQNSNHNNHGFSGKPEVAIIGAGPAGLTAARDLARLGHRSTVFEALPVPGGMITVGMPRFRLPREVRQTDINEILKLGGIEIRTSTPLGKDLTIKDLQAQGYKAILIATGAHKNQKLGIPGEGLEGVINSVSLLQALNLKQPITVGRRVAVVGGGYTAIDSARTAARLRCEKVLLLYRRSFEEMPANAEEVAEARDEGVEIQYLVAPVRILGNEGRVTGIECIRMGLGDPDRSGRRRPVPIQGSEFTIEVDTVIVAVGQRPDLSFLEGDTALTDGRRSIQVDRLTMATKTPGIFAAGDVTGEQGTMIEAIAEGRRAAVSIDRYLRGEDMASGRTKESAPPVEVDPSAIYVPPVERQPMPCLKLEERLGNFEEVDLGFTEEMAVREAQRCLNCAGCSECRECERACELGALDHDAAPEAITSEFDAVIGPADRASTLPPLPGVYYYPSGRDGGLGETLALSDRVLNVLGQQSGNGSKQSAESPGRLPPEARLGVCICRCGGNISDAVSLPEVMRYSRGLPGVMWCGEVSYACIEEAAAGLKSIARARGLTHIVVAGCACCNLEQVCLSCTDRRIRCKANLLDGSQAVYYEFINIREHCAWAYGKEKATAKAETLIGAAVAQARLSQRPSGRVNLACFGNGEPAGDGWERVMRGGAPAHVERSSCRGCGKCTLACEYSAVALSSGPDARYAEVNRARCVGCGACVAVCPNGAMSQDGFDVGRLSASLEAILKR